MKLTVEQINHIQGMSYLNSLKSSYKECVEMIPIEFVAQYREYDSSRLRDPETVSILCADIIKKGIVEPLMLEIGQKDQKVSLGEGNHRLAAAEQLGLEYVPVRILRRMELGSEPRSVTANRPNVAITKVPVDSYFPADSRPSDVFINANMYYTNNKRYSYNIQEATMSESKVYLFTPPKGHTYYAEDVSRVGEGNIVDGKFTGKIKSATANIEMVYPHSTIHTGDEAWHKTHNHPTYNTVMVDSIEVENVIEAKFKIGDKVIYKNSNGVVFGERVIIGLEQTKDEPKYFIEPTDTPWFAIRESQLRLKKIDLQKNTIDPQTETIERLSEAIIAIAKERFPDSSIRTQESSLGGQYRPSLTVAFALGKDRSEWPNQIKENDRGYTVFLVHCKRDDNNIISDLTLNGGISGYRDPQTHKRDKLAWRDIKKPTNIDGVLKNIAKYFDSMKEVVQGIKKSQGMER